MEGILCGYYDEEMEQDVPLEPTVDEAILLFRNFHWENESEESTLKLLIFQISGADMASLHISSLGENTWCISAAVSNRRRFCGPFFQRKTFNLFIDNSALETETLIHQFYQCSLGEFTALLESSDQ